MPTLPRSIRLCALTLVLFHTGHSGAATSPNGCPPSGISVRLPPELDPAVNGSSSGSPYAPAFQAPPQNFYTGTWYQKNTSMESYLNNTNMQYEEWPVLPTCVTNATADCPPGTVNGQMVDLTTWGVANPATHPLNFGAIGGGGRPVASVYAIDTPRRLSHANLSPAWDGVFDLKVHGGPSDGYGETWSVLYWGLDRKQTPLMIIYEGPGTVGSKPASPPCLSVFTRDRFGPDPASLDDAMAALAKLGNGTLANEVKRVRPLKWDYALGGGPAICNDGCQKNSKA